MLRRHASDARGSRLPSGGSGRQVIGLTGRWVAAPNQAAMRRLPAVPPFRGNERQLSSVANATFRPNAAAEFLGKLSFNV